MGICGNIFRKNRKNLVLNAATAEKMLARWPVLEKSANNLNMYYTPKCRHRKIQLFS
jgi:hypothetical protein